MNIIMYMQIIRNSALIKAIEKYFTICFFCTSIFVLILLTQVLLLTWLNQFIIGYILVCFLTSFILTIVFFRFIKKDIKLIPHLNLAVISVVIVVSLILILFPHDSFGGRDEAGYSGLAIILSKYHGVSVPSYLFKTPLGYGTSQPGVVLTTPTYVVWLAVQKVLVGVGWMLRSNVILVILGLSSLYSVSTLITKRYLAFVTVLLFSTCMPFLWFSRETMTENMAFFLLWFLILSLFLFIKTKRNYFLVSLFLSSWLFSFTRNEGLFIQIPILITLTAVLFIRKSVPKKRIFFISIIYIFLISLSFLVTNSIEPLTKNVNVTYAVINLSNLITKASFVTLDQRIPFFVFLMLSKQNLSLAIYSFPLVVMLIIISKKKVVKDKILYLCLLGIISVELLKLITPNVTLEQPWMYRRYLYVLLPFGYLSLLILLNRILRQNILVIIVCGILVTNITLSSKIIALKNNWLITEKIEKLVHNISTNDFVIIDGNPLGNYYPASYISWHKEVRNLYKWWIEIGDWQPRDKKYQGIPYSRLFFLSDKEDAVYNNFRLKKIDTAEIESFQLQVNCELHSLAREMKLKTNDMMQLPYLDVINYCSKTDNEIVHLKKILVLYELFYEY